MKKKQDMIEILYKKYHRSLFIIALSYTKDEHWAKDLVQNAFLKAILSYKEGGSFLYWANKVMRNEFYSSMQAMNRIDRRPIDEHNLQDENDILSKYIQDQEKAQLATMISNLKPPYKDVFIEYVYLGMSYQEISKEHGISVENVRQIISRGKKKLIKMMEAEK